MPQSHIDSLGLANLLKTLPPKIVCDALLQSFSIGVHPILPLIYLPTLQKDYNSFWQWCRNSDISQPDNKLRRRSYFSMSSIFGFVLRCKNSFACNLDGRQSRGIKKGQNCGTTTTFTVCKPERVSISMIPYSFYTSLFIVGSQLFQTRCRILRGREIFKPSSADCTKHGTAS